MHRSLFFLIVVMPLAWIAAADPTEGLHEQLIEKSDAIAAVRILETDTTATPADGPMVARAKALKVLKGNLREKKEFRFSETAWVGPNFKAKDVCIVFLERPKASEEKPPAEWRILSNLYAKDGLAVSEDEVPALTLESLRKRLRQLDQAEMSRKSTAH